MTQYAERVRDKHRKKIHGGAMVGSRGLDDRRGQGDGWAEHSASQVIVRYNIRCDVTCAS